MAINRSDLMTGKRLDEGRSRQASVRRASALREMDQKWGLKQVEKDKKNSLIRDRSPRDIEKAIIEDDRYSYKNNIRKMILALLDAKSITTLKQFRGKLKTFGVDTEIRDNNIYATDVDIVVEGKADRATFNLTKMDGRFSVSEILSVLEKKQPRSVVRRTQSEAKSDYYARLNKTLVGYYELAKKCGEKTPPIKIPKRPASIRNDFKVNQRVSEVARVAERIRAKAVPKDYQTHNLPGRTTTTGSESQGRQRSQKVREDTHRGSGVRQR